MYFKFIDEKQTYKLLFFFSHTDQVDYVPYFFSQSVIEKCMLRLSAGGKLRRQLFRVELQSGNKNTDSFLSVRIRLLCERSSFNFQTNSSKLKH